MFQGIWSEAFKPRFEYQPDKVENVLMVLSDHQKGLDRQIRIIVELLRLITASHDLNHFPKNNAKLINIKLKLKLTWLI